MKTCNVLGVPALLYILSVPVNQSSQFQFILALFPLLYSKILNLGYYFVLFANYPSTLKFLLMFAILYTLHLCNTTTNLMK